MGAADTVSQIRQGILAQRVVSVPTDNVPGRWMLHAGPGWGKTSFGSQFPAPIFLQSAGETGLQTLIEYGQIKPTPFLPAARSWQEVRSYVTALRDEDHAYKTLVVDTVNGCEALLKAHIISSEFEGSEKEFQAYGKGAELVATDWARFLDALDQLREKRKILIVLLCHTKIKTFNNPTGSNYDRYTPEMSDKLFGLTYKWVDGALFGAFETQIIGRKGKADQKVKVSSDVQSRVLYTEETAAWSAKQRHGIPPEIECGESAAEAYRSFTEELRRGKAKLRQALSQPVMPSVAAEGAPSDPRTPGGSQAEGSPDTTPINDAGPEKGNGSTPTGETRGHSSEEARNNVKSQTGPSMETGKQNPPATSTTAAQSIPPSSPDGFDPNLPAPVKDMWLRMGTSREKIMDEVQSLRHSMHELVGEKALVEYANIVKQFGDPVAKVTYSRRVVLEMWKWIQATHAEQVAAEIAAEGPQLMLIPMETKTEMVYGQ